MHYSFIIQNNSLIEWGVNSGKTPPIHYGYRDRIKDINFNAKSHSEIEAFRKARGKLDTSYGFEVINIRLNRTGLLRLSKPCGCCFNLLSALGCEKFYYSSELGFLSLRGKI